ncbi:MAG: type III-B CRISPR module RAMP protein Cmr1 [Anaerolineae bacterium]|nr:type III-B CRISPR module RAMP protein Cmr1 [Anaerolineae bacterium]MDW8300455.1 type III-B CRISPR module RAMP protein Cmr1 [Anaerolineae bacterium]
MQKKTYELEVVSPMFSNGADPKAKETLEIRAPSVRGQLRYWLRAIIGAQTTELKKLWEEESEVFGTTELGSKVAVRVYPISVDDDYIEKSEMLPHKDKPFERSPSWAIQPEWTVTLELVAQHGEIPERVLHALHVWSLLGGLGKRSRRMFGAFKLSGGGAPTYSSPEALMDAIKKALKDAKCEVNTSPDIPRFPTLHPMHSWIIVGKRGYEDHKDAVISLFRDLLRNNTFRPKQDSFGGVRPRRSSPLIAQLRLINGRYYPVLTALRSKPDSRIDWNVVRDFMNAAARHFNAERVWGGWS